MFPTRFLSTIFIIFIVESSAMAMGLINSRPKKEPVTLSITGRWYTYQCLEGKSIQAIYLLNDRTFQYYEWIPEFTENGDPQWDHLQQGRTFVPNRIDNFTTGTTMKALFLPTVFVNNLDRKRIKAGVKFIRNQRKKNSGMAYKCHQVIALRTGICFLQNGCYLQLVTDKRNPKWYDDNVFSYS